MHLPLSLPRAPSRAAFLTGRHGWQLGIITTGQQPVLAAETVLLPELLRDLGYRTALVVKFHANVRARAGRHTGRVGRLDAASISSMVSLAA